MLEREDEEMLDWLSAPYHSQKHDEIKSKRVAGTGDWLLQTQEFQKWTRKGQTSLVCLGGPGVGKSVLM